VSLIGTVNLLWLSIFTLCLCLILLVRILRAYPQAFVHSESTHPDAPETSKGRVNVLKNPFVIVIFVEAFIWILAYFINDNIYYIETAKQYTDADQLASIIGLLSALAAILTMLSGLFFTGPFINRFGVKVSVRVTPFLVVVLMLAFAVVAGFMHNPLLAFAVIVVAHTVTPL